MSKLYSVLAMLVFVAALFIAINYRSAQQARFVRYDLSFCNGKLKKIDVAMWNYLADENSFPDRLEALVSRKYLKEEDLTCPGDLSMRVGYDYIETRYKEGVFPVISDKKGNHPGAVNVLMSDGIVLIVPEDKIDQAVSEYVNMDRMSKHIPYQGYPPKY